MLPAFKDKRYIRVDGKLLFMIYRPLTFEGIARFLNLWNQLAKENGLGGFYFVGYTLMVNEEYNNLKELGFDGVCSCRLGNRKKRSISWMFRRIISIITKIPVIIQYKNVMPSFVQSFEKEHEDVFPTMLPNWDHTPRSGTNGYLYANAIPELFEKHAEAVLEVVKDRKQCNRICFLKSWN